MISSVISAIELLLVSVEVFLIIPKTRKSEIAVFKCWSLIFLLNQLFYVASTSWVTSDNRRKEFSYVFADLGVFQILHRLDDIPLSIRLSFRMGLTLSCFLSSRYTSHCSMRWSIVRIVLHRSQSGWFPLVSTYFCVIFIYPTIIFDITTWSRIFRVGGIMFLYKSFFMVSSRGFTKVFHSLFQRCLIFCLVGK